MSGCLDGIHSALQPLESPDEQQIVMDMSGYWAGCVDDLCEVFALPPGPHIEGELHGLPAGDNVDLVEGAGGLPDREMHDQGPLLVDERHLVVLACHGVVPVGGVGVDGEL